MDINTFFITAIREKAHYKRAWLFHVFGVTLDDPTKPSELAWTPTRTSTNVQVRLPSGELDVLSDAVLGEPLLHAKTVVYVPQKWFEHWPEGGFTTAGNLLYNACALWDVVGSRFGYMNGKIEEKKIEALFATMKDDPAPGEERKEGVTYVGEWLKYGQAIKFLEEAAPLFVTTLSLQSIVPNKEVIAYKEKLIEAARQAGTLDDVVVQAKIIKEVEDLDMKLLANDPGVAFITAGKNKLARRKLTGLYGTEHGLDASAKPIFITQSLADGLRPEHMVAVLNVSRAGSFDRGSETMLGGVEAKWGDRDTMGAAVQDEDCGTRLGYTFLVTPRNVSNAMSRWRITPNGQELVETIAQALALVGQTITVRSPSRCAAGPSTTWCKYCLGADLSANPRAVGSSVSAYGSGFLQLFLKAMHAKAPVTVKMRVRSLMS